MKKLFIGIAMLAALGACIYASVLGKGAAGTGFGLGVVAVCMLAALLGEE